MNILSSKIFFVILSIILLTGYNILSNTSSLEKAKEFITENGLSCNGLDYELPEKFETKAPSEKFSKEFEKHFSENNIRCTRESKFIFGQDGKSLFE